MNLEAMNPKRRKKASDLAEERAFVGPKQSFNEAFPMIKDIHVEFARTSLGSESGKQSYNKDTLGDFLNCFNPLCHAGGFSIREMLDEMIASRVEEREFHRTCMRYEGSPKGKVTYRRCSWSYVIRVRIMYYEINNFKT